MLTTSWPIVMRSARALLLESEDPGGRTCALCLARDRRRVEVSQVKPSPSGLSELARVSHQHSRGAQEPLRRLRVKAVKIAAVAFAEGATGARRATMHPTSPLSLDCRCATTPAGSGPGSTPGRSVQARRFTRRVHRADCHFWCSPSPCEGLMMPTTPCAPG